HRGLMVQFGLNRGARHAELYGYAKSYVKNLDEETKDLHDEDVIGAAGIAWQLIKASSPPEIITHVEECLEKAGLPGWLQIILKKVGPGYRIRLGGIEYGFPLAERSPPEVYLTRGYCTYVIYYTGNLM
ncbi:hypothetical protein K474DRAFT_1593925, partial [Panus rudis PR-1116 ss-1]